MIHLWNMQDLVDNPLFGRITDLFFLQKRKVPPTRDGTYIANLKPNTMKNT